MGISRVAHPPACASTGPKAREGLGRSIPSAKLVASRQGRCGLSTVSAGSRRRQGTLYSRALPRLHRGRATARRHHLNPSDQVTRHGPPRSRRIRRRRCGIGGIPPRLQLILGAQKEPPRGIPEVPPGDLKVIVGWLPSTGSVSPLIKFNYVCQFIFSNDSYAMQSLFRAAQERYVSFIAISVRLVGDA